MDALVSLPYLLRLVTGGVSKGFDEAGVSVERRQGVGLEIDVQVRVDLGEAVALVPALDVRVVTCPCLEPNEPPSRACRSAARKSDDPIPWRWRSGCTARCQIIPPRPGRSASPSLSHSRSRSPMISRPSSATSSMAGFP